MKLLNERDGLMLGICNGFQALIKLGLVPEGKIIEQKADSPTLTYEYHRTPCVQDGKLKGRFQQVPVACRRRTWRRLLQTRYPTARDVS